MRFLLTIALLILQQGILTLLIQGRASAQVVLVKPESTAKFLAPDNPDKQIEDWTSTILSLLRESGVDPVVENESFLVSNPPRSTLILLHAELLSVGQIKILQEHLNQGNGLWICSATGYRDETGKVRGWDFLQNLLGGTIDSVDYTRGAAVSLQMRYGQPGSSNVPPGYRLRLALQEKPLFLKMGNSEEIVGYWAREKYVEEIPDSIPRQAGIIARSLLSGGRVVWMGAGIEGLHVDPVNKEMALKVIGELVAWLDGNGIPSVEAWPDGKKCAVMVHGDIEDKFESVKRLTGVFKRKNIPVTYNVLTSEAAKFPQTIEEMAKTGAEISVHGDNHKIFAGQTYQTQVDRLKSTAGFVTLYGPPPTTFRPPELSYDDNTLRAAKVAGFTNFLAYNQADRDYPVFSTQERSIDFGLVCFPKSELDDYDLSPKVIEKSDLEKSHSFIGDFNRIYDLHGLYKLNFHSQYLNTEELPKAVEETLIEIQRHDDVWFADARTIANWIRVRGRLLLQTNSNSSVIHLSLTNTSSAPARDVVLRILPPQNVPAELLIPSQVSENCQYDVRNGVLYASIPTLKPGEIFKMELGASDGIALSAVNKNIIVTGAKALAALIAIFILWFIMYLAFSGKKIKPVFSSGSNSVPESGEETFYRKLGIKPPSADQKVIDEAHKSPVAPIPAQPNMTQSGGPLASTRTIPSVSVTLTAVPGKRLSPITNPHSEIAPSSQDVYRLERISRIPTLPVVMKPLTATERKVPSTDTHRKIKPIAPIHPTVIGSEITKIDEPRSARVINPPPPLKDTGNQTQAPKPIIAPPGGEVSRAPQVVTQTVNRGSATFQSPAGIRTTANLPKTNKQTPLELLQSNDPSYNPPSQQKQAQEPKGMARTSVDIFRKHQSKTSNGEEWQ